MTKNKKPASFWKKLVGKNKSSISTLQPEPKLIHDDKKEATAETERSSSSLFYKISSPPTPKPIQQLLLQPEEQIVEDISSKADHDLLHRIDHQEEKDTSITIISTEQPNVTPAAYSNSNKQSDNESISSFIVLDKQKDEAAELQSIIDSLKSELDTEKATNQVLQRQKQAVAKDLDYFEITIDELLAEKNDLVQKLEHEKIQSQQHLDELNLLLQKMKSNADNARNLSMVKSELKSLQKKTDMEHNTHLIEISEKDDQIRELKSKLDKSQEQTEELKETIEYLMKNHAEELSRVATTSAKETEEQSSKPDTIVEIGTPVEMKPVEVRKKISHIPLPHSFLKPAKDSESMLRIDALRKENHHNLDDQLLKLIKEKEKLQSSYSKLPLNGGGPKYRRRKEDLESMLDQVDSQLSKVKQKIKNF